MSASRLLLQGFLVTTDRSHNLLTLTTEIVAAHLAGNKVSAGDLPMLIANVHRALAGLKAAPSGNANLQQPAVPVRSSIKHDNLVCLGDGRKQKALERHLVASHAMTPAPHRDKWELPLDYPMVALGQSESRVEPAAERHSAGEMTGDQPTAGTAVGMATELSMPAEPGTGRKILTLFKTRDAEVRQTDTAKRTSDPTGQSTDWLDDIDGPQLVILRAAIARRVCVTAIYNKARVTLAPHLLFERHDEPFLRAVTMLHDGRRPRELKLGTFKLAGLGALAVTSKGFSTFPDYSSALDDHAGNIICALSLTSIAAHEGFGTPAMRRAG